MEGNTSFRLQGVNWRSKEALDCNGGLNPLQQYFNDGINIGPLEAMFTKVSTSIPQISSISSGFVIHLDVSLTSVLLILYFQCLIEDASCHQVKSHSKIYVRR